MKNVIKLNLGLEAIQVQSDKFFKELVLCFDKLDDLKRTISASDVLGSGITEVIKHYTGLTANVFLKESNDINAYVHIPELDSNNVMIPNHMRMFVGNDGFEKLKKTKSNDIINGTVDLSTGRVGGDFAKYPCEVYLHRGLIDTRIMTNYEKAAITLHEVGHLFTYFEWLGHTLTTNVILHASTQAFFNADSTVKRMDIIDETCKSLAINGVDKEELVKCTSREVYQTIIVRSALQDSKSALGSWIYDITSTEAMADQYAMRQGVGRHLVTGMDKLSRHYGSSSYQSTATHIACTIFKVFLFLAGVMMTFGMFLLILLWDPSQKMYDEPKARLTRMRNELMATVKAKGISKEQKDQAVADLAACDSIIKRVDDKRGLLELFYTSVLPSGRKQYEQLKFQVQLERLANNDLFAAAHKLNSLDKV